MSMTASTGFYIGSNKLRNPPNDERERLEKRAEALAELDPQAGAGGQGPGPSEPTPMPVDQSAGAAGSAGATAAPGTEEEDYEKNSDLSMFGVRVLVEAVHALSNIAYRGGIEIRKYA